MKGDRISLLFLLSFIISLALSEPVCLPNPSCTAPNIPSTKENSNKLNAFVLDKKDHPSKQVYLFENLNFGNQTVQQNYFEKFAEFIDGNIYLTLKLQVNPSGRVKTNRIWPKSDNLKEGEPEVLEKYRNYTKNDWNVYVKVEFDEEFCENEYNCEIIDKLKEITKEELNRVIEKEIVFQLSPLISNVQLNGVIFNLTHPRTEEIKNSFLVPTIMALRDYKFYEISLMIGKPQTFSGKCISEGSCCLPTDKQQLLKDVTFPFTAESIRQFGDLIDKYWLSSTVTPSIVTMHQIFDALFSREIQLFQNKIVVGVSPSEHFHFCKLDSFERKNDLPTNSHNLLQLFHLLGIAEVFVFEDRVQSDMSFFYEFIYKWKTYSVPTAHLYHSKTPCDTESMYTFVPKCTANEIYAAAVLYNKQECMWEGRRASTHEDDHYVTISKGGKQCPRENITVSLDIPTDLKVLHWCCRHDADRKYDISLNASPPLKYVTLVEGSFTSEEAARLCAGGNNKQIEAEHKILENYASNLCTEADLIAAGKKYKVKKTDIGWMRSGGITKLGSATKTLDTDIDYAADYSHIISNAWCCTSKTLDKKLNVHRVKPRREEL